MKVVGKIKHKIRVCQNKVVTEKYGVIACSYRLNPDGTCPDVDRHEEKQIGEKATVLKEYQSFLAHKPTFHAATLEEAMARGDAYEKGWADGYWRYREGCVYGINSVSEQCAQDYNDGFNEALVRFAKDEAEKKAEEEAAKEKASKETSGRAPMADHDPVNAPSYYRSHPSGVECIQITEHMNFNLGNALKYLWRNGLKEGNSAVRDLEKSVFYIQREIDRLGRVT